MTRFATLLTVVAVFLTAFTPGGSKAAQLTDRPLLEQFVHHIGPRHHLRWQHHHRHIRRLHRRDHGHHRHPHYHPHRHRFHYGYPAPYWAKPHPHQHGRRKHDQHGRPSQIYLGPFGIIIH